MRSAVAIGVMLVLAGCEDAQPCTGCPPIDGTYAVTWALDAGVVADGGLIDPACPGPRPATWQITERSASQVTLAIGDAVIGGTLYDTYDLLLGGSVGEARWQVRGFAVSEGSIADAGMRLEGTFTSSSPTASGDLCQSRESFTAQRVSR